LPHFCIPTTTTRIHHLFSSLFNNPPTIDENRF
jgi:hypothetical protein